MNANIDTEQLKEVWKASLLDVSKGFATGPWYDEDEISQALGTAPVGGDAALPDTTRRESETN